MKNDFQKGLDELLKKAEIPTTKKKFVIDIEEAVVSSFEVEAETLEEAMEIAEEKYWRGEFIVCPGDVAARQMRASSEDFWEQTEWTEF